MEMEDFFRVTKNIAKAVVAVIEIFEQIRSGGIGMDIIKAAKMACKVVGGVISIVSALRG